MRILILGRAKKISMLNKNVELKNCLEKVYLFPNDPRKNAELFRLIESTDLKKELADEFLILFYLNGKSFDDELAKVKNKKVKVKLNEIEKSEIKECLAFLKKHFQYAITLKINPKKYAINEYRNFEFEIIDNKILFKNFEDIAKSNFINSSTDLFLDFVITKNKDLRIGYKHYYLSNESSFVYGAGRLHINSSGEILNIDNYSGHYHANKKDLMNSVYLLREINLKIKNISYMNFHFLESTSLNYHKKPIAKKSQVNKSLF